MRIATLTFDLNREDPRSDSIAEQIGTLLGKDSYLRLTQIRVGSSVWTQDPDEESGNR